jgi:hypothetical protein
MKNEKRKKHHKIKCNGNFIIGYFVVIKTKSPVGKTWEICPRLLIALTPI